ncbi:hypothetical protein DBV15_07292 [Temnothorax longispinosus]|uniref:Tesmin/TSO1-like CXC domain-containing protein n=1 Tax=Temnothorax longispinosus TaxID=300112 RepID=A0A4V3SCQ9_9HYME|nr:hypothetical protein DBV15_07292 [Temnothorax longispinosus]
MAPKKYVPRDYCRCEHKTCKKNCSCVEKKILCIKTCWCISRAGRKCQNAAEETTEVAQAAALSSNTEEASSSADDDLQTRKLREFREKISRETTEVTEAASGSGTSQATSGPSSSNAESTSIAQFLRTSPTRAGDAVWNITEVTEAASSSGTSQATYETQSNLIFKYPTCLIQIYTCQQLTVKSQELTILKKEKDEERRIFLNKMQELSGNIRVISGMSQATSGPSSSNAESTSVGGARPKDLPKRSKTQATLKQIQPLTRPIKAELH